MLESVELAAKSKSSGDSTNAQKWKMLRVANNWNLVVDERGKHKDNLNHIAKENDFLGRNFSKQFDKEGGKRKKDAG